jgi:glucan phosphoethanolaminetransferase (alkaline phosphatase superfamily)
MKKIFVNRTWISPMTAISFLVVSITGILLALHVKMTGNIKSLHEWLGYVFTLICLLHLVLNWNVFAAYFRKRLAMLATFACIALSLVIMFASGAPKQKPNPTMQVLDTNSDGIIDANEMAAAASMLAKLDTNRDGVLSLEEVQIKGGPNGARPAK